MRGVIVHEPDLQLPELPRGVTEVTIRRGGRVYVTHTRKPWTEVLQDCMRLNSSSEPIGGPTVQAKVRPDPPKRQHKARAVAMPYRDT